MQEVHDAIHGNVFERATRHRWKQSAIRILDDGDTAVLGSAVRDPGLLRRILDELPASERLYRQGAVVALGAMGGAVAPADAMRDAHDEAGLNAYLLVTALTPMDIHTRVARACAMSEHVAPELRVWLREIIERLGGGDTISAIMQRRASVSPRLREPGPFNGETSHMDPVTDDILRRARELAALGPRELPLREPARINKPSTYAQLLRGGARLAEKERLLREPTGSRVARSPHNDRPRGGRCS